MWHLLRRSLIKNVIFHSYFLDYQINLIPSVSRLIWLLENRQNVVPYVFLSQNKILWQNIRNFPMENIPQIWWFSVLSWRFSCGTYPYDPWCWNIYHHLPYKSPSYVAKYASTMVRIWDSNAHFSWGSPIAMVEKNGDLNPGTVAIHHTPTPADFSRTSSPAIPKSFSDRSNFFTPAEWPGIRRPTDKTWTPAAPRHGTMQTRRVESELEHVTKSYGHPWPTVDHAEKKKVPNLVGVFSQEMLRVPQFMAS